MYGFSAWGAPDSAIVTDGYVVMYCSGQDGSNNWFQKPIALEPGKTYKYYVDFKTPDAKKARQVVLRPGYEQVLGVLSENSDWLSTSMIFQVESADTILLSVYRWGADKEVHIDNMKLVELTEPLMAAADDGEIMEGAENGEVITVTLSNAKYAESADPANWSVSNLPAGVSIGSVSFKDSVTAEITLSGNASEDYDTYITYVVVSAARDEFSTYSKPLAAQSGGVTFTAVVELPTIEIADDGELKEGAENGEIITVKLTLDTFVETLTPSNWSVTNRPVGVSVGEVWRVDSVTVEITLSGNATEDYDTDITDLTVTIGGSELSSFDVEVSANSGVTFIATVETEIEGMDVSGLKVFPNPVTDHLMINADLEISRVRVFNVLGKLVEDMENLNARRVRVNAEQWEPGLHFIHITDVKGNRRVARVTK
jgi:hypothetical protein